jgi:cobalamin biosynthesis Mg chelatase CobN
MTTSGRARKPAQQQGAETGTAPGGGPPSDAAAAGGPPESAAQISGESAASGDEQELRAEIEQTREQLGQTVEQLAAKADVKGRMRAKAAQLTGRAKGKTAQARAKATDRGTGVHSQVTDKTVRARQKAAAVAGTGKGQLQARAAPVWQATPEPVRRAVRNGASTARQRRVPLAAAALALGVGFVAFRWWRRR